MHKPTNFFTRAFLWVAVCVLSPSAFADWTLDNDRSQLTFVSIKAGHIAEIHRFTQLKGQVNDAGQVTAEIVTASIDSMIAIRDERMREFLFESEIFPNITVTANIDPEQLNDLQPGDGAAQSVDAKVTFKDRELDVAMQLIALRLNDTTLLVNTLQPILLNTASVGFDTGVNKLQELAGLPSISQAVPVSFTLTFVDED